FRVMNMAEIAWEQIGMGDRPSAEATIAAALVDNEGQRWGSDQVNGWVMLAEDLAALGDYERALQVAQKIDPPDEFGARALQLVAYRQTLAGHADSAILWARALTDPEARAGAFIGIASGLIEQITGKEQDIVKY